MNSPTATRFAQYWFVLPTTYLCLFLLLNYDWFVLHIIICLRFSCLRPCLRRHRILLCFLRSPSLEKVHGMSSSAIRIRVMR
jgi:hypothetical protein